MPGAFHRKFIAGVSAAAIFITALGASQAQAQDRSAERALAALLGLAVVGAIIANKQSDDRKDKAVTRNRPHHGVKPRPVPRRVQRSMLPRECLRMVRTGRGQTERVLGGRCLRRNYAFVDHLPRRCVQRLNRHRGAGPAQVWNGRCLQRNGYRLSRR